MDTVIVRTIGSVTAVALQKTTLTLGPFSPGDVITGLLLSAQQKANTTNTSPGYSLAVRMCDQPVPTGSALNPGGRSLVVPVSELDNETCMIPQPLAGPAAANGTIAKFVATGQYRVPLCVRVGDDFRWLVVFFGDQSVDAWFTAAVELHRPGWNLLTLDSRG